MSNDSPQFVKAKFFRKDNPSDPFEVQFNPKDYSISKSTKWIDIEVDGKDEPVKVFVGGEAKTFTVSLWFDTTDTGASVKSSYQKLLDFAEIDEDTSHAKTYKSEPPVCQFQWGSVLLFTGVITKVDQQFLMFKPDGTPVRAKVTVTFGETAEATAGQNPTTRSMARKTWVVHEGQTLDWIAYREYGDPAQWRHIADTNDLANPLHLKAGQVLKLVPLP